MGRQNSINDRVVLVTGASDGIGAACVRAFRASGARLSLNGRSEEKLARVAHDGDLVTAADLTTPGTPQALVDRTVERFGRIDLVINNAGHGIFWPIAQTPIAEARAMFDLLFWAPMALAQAAIPPMRAQGSGSIVDVGSIAGDVSLPWMPLYSVSKTALGALTASLRSELAGTGIHVMLVCPGYVLTNFHDHSFGLQPPAKVIARKRFAITPDQCAGAILRGVDRRADLVVTPRWGWFLIGAHRLIPRTVEKYLRGLDPSMESV